MAWPRIKNSRSSAQPETQPHDGVQATVTPAADADPPPRSSQNTGVIGTTYAVAENPTQDARSPRHDRSASRRLGPIRYAHSGVDETPAPEEAEAVEAVEPAPSAAPADDGISIFGDMATSEVPDESGPTLDFRRPHHPPADDAAGRGHRPAAAGPADPIPVGGSWNRTVTSSARPVEPAPESKPGPFGIRGGGRRPPQPAATASLGSAFAIFPRMCRFGSGGHARSS